MKPPGKFVVVVGGSFLAGAAVFVSSFAVFDFAWTYFVIGHSREAGLGDGVVVVGGGFVVGITLGLATLAFLLYRFWPRRN
jgi:hypothetical protein